MSGPFLGLVGFCVVLLLIMLRMPVAIAMGAVWFSVARKPQAGPAGPKSDWPTRVASLKDGWKVLLLFGAMPITVCEIGMIMPPVGINLFVIQGVGKLPMATLVRGILPFALADFVRLFLICLFPWLATWLPNKSI